MITSPESLSDVELRRQEVASWIEAAIKPVEHILHDETNINMLPVVDSVPDNPQLKFEIRDHQLDAWGALWDARQAGADRGLIHLATGLGKTRVGIFDALKFREEFRAQHGRDPKILFTVHQNAILQQAAASFKSFIPDASIGFYNQFRKDTGGDITFATLQALYANLGVFGPGDFDYLINDEVHHAKAHTYEQVIKYFKPQFRLGLTATPNRPDEKDIRELYGPELYSKGLAAALAEKLLATPDYHIVFDDAVKEVMQSGFEPTTLKALAELFSVPPRNDVIAQNIKDEAQRIGLEFGSCKTIVFCQSIEHAEEIAQLLDARAYHSKAKNLGVYEAFMSGELTTITTRDMFNEGVDVPDARLIVLLRSTASSTVFEQQLGRGLRKIDGKNRVSILDFVANIERIAIVKQLAEDVQSRGGGKVTDVISSPVGIDTPGAFGNGLNIHTNNGDFDFDKMAIDLLEKYADILAKDTAKFTNFSNEEIIELAKAISPQTPLTVNDMIQLSKDRLFPAPATIYSRFGGARAFQVACGFEVTSMNDYSDEELVALALQICPDRPLSQDAMNQLSKDKEFASPSLISTRFGNLTNFYEACGFVTTTSLNNLSDDELIKMAKTYSPDSPMTLKDIKLLSKSKQFISGHEVVKRFGSISAFHERCGFGVNYKAMSDDELIELAKRLSPDKPLSQDDVVQLSKDKAFVSASNLAKRFGSISAFHERCGFGVNYKAMSDDELIELAKRLSPDKPLSGEDISQLSRAGQFLSVSSISKRFGGTRAFHERCGFGVNKFAAIQNDDLVALAQSLSPDKPLIANAINELSKSGEFVSASQIARRFGSIKNFQKACGW